MWIDPKWKISKSLTLWRITILLKNLKDMSNFIALLSWQYTRLQLAYSYISQIIQIPLIWKTKIDIGIAISSLNSKCTSGPEGGLIATRKVEYSSIPKVCKLVRRKDIVKLWTRMQRFTFQKRHPPQKLCATSYALVTGSSPFPNTPGRNRMETRFVPGLTTSGPHPS